MLCLRRLYDFLRISWIFECTGTPDYLSASIMCRPSLTYVYAGPVKKCCPSPSLRVIVSSTSISAAGKLVETRGVGTKPGYRQGSLDLDFGATPPHNLESALLYLQIQAGDLKLYLSVEVPRQPKHTTKTNEDLGCRSCGFLCAWRW